MIFFIFHNLSTYNFLGDDMFKGLLKKNEVLQEFVGELKCKYQAEILEVINYHKLYSIYEKEVILSKINIKGEGLKVIYQDPVKIIIKGKKSICFFYSFK